MIESTFTLLKNGFFAFTSEGYIVKVTANSYYKHQSNPVFSNKNPYTIYNIHRYVQLNNIPTILLSKEYINQSSPLKWLCTCGKTVEISWQHFLQGKTTCQTCTCRKNRPYNVAQVHRDFDMRGYDLLSEIIHSNNDFVEYICRRHQEFGVQRICLNKFYYRNQGCRFCGKEKSGHHKRLQTSACKTLTENKGLQYINSHCDNGKTYIDFICDRHVAKGVQTCSATQMRNTKFGCKYCNISRYRNEELIASILNSWNIKFESQKKFAECKDKRVLPFDFYIRDFNTCIEYQGEQHYNPIPRGRDNTSQAQHRLAVTQRHDMIKRNYCKQNNMILIEIPFWENDDLTNYLFDQFVLHGLIIETTIANK